MTFSCLYCCEQKFLADICVPAMPQVRELTSIVRNQIADSTTRGGQKGLLDDYADVVYRAWRATDGLCRYEVEETLIQVRCTHERAGPPQQNGLSDGPKRVA